MASAMSQPRFRPAAPVVARRVSSAAFESFVQNPGVGEDHATRQKLNDHDVPDRPQVPASA